MQTCTDNHMQTFTDTYRHTGEEADGRTDWRARGALGRVAPRLNQASSCVSIMMATPVASAPHACRVSFTGWARNHFNNLQFKKSLKTQHNT